MHKRGPWLAEKPKTDIEKFIKRELDNREVDPKHYVYADLMKQCLEAADILSRKQLSELISDRLELESGY